MPISVKCPNCGRGIKAPDAALGKQVPCPACKRPFLVQASAPAPAQAPGYQPAPVSGNPFDFAGGGGAAPAPTPAAPQMNQGQWHVSINGQQYGPISKTELDQWVNEGRVNDACMIFCEGWTNWKAFAEVYGAGGGLPQPAPVPRIQVNVKELVRDSSGNVELGWHFLGKGLRISQVGLGIGTLSLVLLMTSVFLLKSNLNSMVEAQKKAATGKMSRDEMRKAQKSVEGQMKFTQSMFGASYFGTFGSLVVIFTGWFLCFSTPRRARAFGWAIGAVISLGLTLLLLLLLITSAAGPGGMGAASGGPGRPSVRGSELTKIFVLLLFLTWFVGYALHSWLLSQISGSYFRQRGFPLHSIIYSAFAGIVIIWSIVFLFVFVKASILETPDSFTSFLTVMAITFLAFAIPTGWLCFLNTLVLGTIKRAVR